MRVRTGRFRRSVKITREGASKAGDDTGRQNRFTCSGAIRPLRSARLTLCRRFGPSPCPTHYGRRSATTPSADFCRPFRINRSILSRDSTTNGRSPEVSSTAFRAQPPDLQPVPLMDMDFVIICSLVRHRMPQIRFLYIGSHVCSTLLSDPASRRRPCAWLSLRLHQAVKGTFTPELSNMLGTPTKAETILVFAG